MIGLFCAVMNQSLLFTAQPTLMHAFHVGTSTIQWLSTIYPLIVGVLMPLTGWLADNVSTKTLLLSSYLIFFIGSLCCTAAVSFPMMLAGRIIQALGGGMIQGISMAVLFTIYRGKGSGTITILTGVVFGFAPAIGPTLAGWLIQISSWHLVFGILLPLILVAIILGSFMLRPIIPHQPSRLDGQSVVLSTVGFALLLYGISTASDAGWTSPQIIIAILVGVIGVAWFLFRQAHIANPVLSLKPFKNFQYTLCLAVYAISILVLTGMEFILPLYLQEIHQLTPFQSGIAMIFGAVCAGVFSFVAGGLMNHGHGRLGIIIGMVLVVLSALSFVTVGRNTSIVYVAVMYGVINIALSLSSTPSQTFAINALPKQLISQGNAAINMVRQIATSFGLSILVSVMQLVEHAQGNDSVTSQLAGYHAAFGVVVIVSLITLVFSFRITKPATA